MIRDQRSCSNYEFLCVLVHFTCCSNKAVFALMQQFYNPVQCKALLCRSGALKCAFIVFQVLLQCMKAQSPLNSSSVPVSDSSEPFAADCRCGLSRLLIMKSYPPYRLIAPCRAVMQQPVCKDSRRGRSNAFVLETGMNAAVRAVTRMGIYVGAKVYLIYEVCHPLCIKKTKKAGGVASKYDTHPFSSTCGRQGATRLKSPLK